MRHGIWLSTLQGGIWKCLFVTRVAFVGKGGRGKTTLASLFNRYLSAQKVAVLAICSQFLNQSPKLRDC